MINGYKVILVTGSRNWNSVESVAKEMSKYPFGTIFVHGYADGADLCCHLVAKELGFGVLPNPAHWNHSCKRWKEVYGPCPKSCREYVGRAAGPIRNRKMLKLYGDILDGALAFHEDLKNSKGTKDMVKILEKAGIHVDIFNK